MNLGKQTVDSFNGNEQAALVFLDRYAMKDNDGYCLEVTWDELCDRLEAELKPVSERIPYYKPYLREAIKHIRCMEFVPGGRILSSVGTGRNNTLYNCLTLPRPKDNLEDIFRLDRELGFSHKRGAGVGFRIDSLRPEGQYLSTSSGRASGAVSFMKKYNASANVICQGGSRRGATLINMSIQHPEIRKFIHCKDSGNDFENMNISVMINEEFMKAVHNRETYELKFPVDDDIYKDGKCRVSNIVGARDLWQDVCMSAWKSGDPCLQVWDRMERYNNHQYCYPIESTNACSEIPLPSYGLCLLGAVNFASFVEDGGFKVDDFIKCVANSVVFLDMLIEAGHYPLEETKKVQRKLRKIGLGFVGLAEALIKMNCRYGSSESKSLIEDWMSDLQTAAYTQSIDIAKNLGAFPAFKWDGYKRSAYCMDLPFGILQDIQTHGIRNATILSCQPTGTTSILAGTSSGIEPLFMREYTRNDRLGKRYVQDPVWARHKSNKDIVGSIVTAHEIAPRDRVDIQSIVQMYIDQAISSTVNLPNNATPFDVMEIYDYAYELNLKNITVFRDGCKTGVMESVGTKERCSSCGSDHLKHEQGCTTCLACGWSKCDV